MFDEYNNVVNGPRYQNVIETASIENNLNNNKKHDIIHSVSIIGDSMLNNIEGKGISNKGNVKVLPIPGTTSHDMKDDAN